MIQDVNSAFSPDQSVFKWLDHVLLETSGDVLSTVDMVVQRRDGPRWLREHDDDDESVFNFCSTATRLSRLYAATLPRPVYESSFCTSKEVHDTSHNRPSASSSAERENKLSLSARACVRWLAGT